MKLHNIFIVLGVIGLGFSVAISIEMIFTALVVLAIAYVTKVIPEPKLFVMLGMTALGMIFSIGLIAFGNYITPRR